MLSQVKNSLVSWQRLVSFSVVGFSMHNYFQSQTMYNLPTSRLSLVVASSIHKWIPFVRNSYQIVIRVTAPFFCFPQLHMFTKYRNYSWLVSGRMANAKITRIQKRYSIIFSRSWSVTISGDIGTSWIPLSMGGGGLASIALHVYIVIAFSNFMSLIDCILVSVIDWN